jgi:hypothetical protein
VRTVVLCRRVAGRCFRTALILAASSTLPALGCAPTDAVPSAGGDGGVLIPGDAMGVIDTGAPVDSPRAGDAQPPSNFGWSEAPNTQLRAVCPPSRADYDFSRCEPVISAWSGGAPDVDGDRLIVWGGGHNDYYGNEVYAFHLADLSLKRLNDPSPINPTPDNCIPELPDHTPNSKHTYGGLAYIAHAKRMYAYGGASACRPGGFTTDTWTLDLSTLIWKRMDPTVGGEPQGGLGASDYDPVSKRVFLSNTNELWDYDFDTNTYRRLQSNASTDYHLTGVVDPGRHIFFLMGNKGANGGGVLAFRIGPGSVYAMENWTAEVTGCDGLVAKLYPGLAYDPSRNLVVGWAGGSSVYLFDPDKKSCTEIAYPGGPGPQQQNGTNGRWRYLPKGNVFALVNDWAQNSYTLRLPLP